MAYARHQSFYLRDKWTSKGLKSVTSDSRFFYDPESFEKIGLGKNMVQSLRFWLSAMNLIESVGNNSHQLTELGHLIYNKDRLLQNNDTISILHYQLIRNKEDLATVFDWYFNTYKEPVSQREGLVKSFITYVKTREGKEVSPKSLKRDIDCLVQLYTKDSNEMDPEDFVFSPFAKMKILSEEPSEEGSDSIYKLSPEIENIGLSALYYVLLSYSHENDVEMISLEEIINEKYLLGKVFNLSRNKIIEALNKLTNHDVYPIEYVRTNNLDNVRLPRLSPLEYLYHEWNFNLDRVKQNNDI